MRNMWIIFLKEMKRVFLDKRMLLGLFLPGILIYFVYTLMGNVMSSQLLSTTTKDTTYEVVYTDNFSSDNTVLPKLLTYMDAALVQENQGNTAHKTMIPYTELDAYKEELKQNKIHLIISFSNEFEQSVLSESSGNNISLYYNGESNASSDLYSMTASLVQVAYTNYTQNMEGNKSVEPNVGKKDMLTMKIIAMVVPMVTISLLFSTVVSLCPEAIAGEKERGTLASLLLTPIKRKDFVFGKILSLCLLAIASGTTSFLGLMLSMPKLMGGLNLTIAPVEYLLLFLIVISTLLFFIGLGVFISSFANTTKEATAYMSPLMIVFMLFGIAPSLLGLNQWYCAFIPVLNVCASVNALLTGQGNLPLLLGLTIASNIVYTGLFIFFVTKLFEKERVVLGQ